MEEIQSYFPENIAEEEMLSAGDDFEIRDDKDRKTSFKKPPSYLQRFFQRLALSAFVGAAACSASLKNRKETQKTRTANITLNERDTMIARIINRGTLTISASREIQYAVVAVHPSLTQLQDHQREEIARYLKWLSEKEQSTASENIALGDVVKILRYGPEGEYGKYLGTIGENIFVELSRRGVSSIEMFRYGEVIAPGKRIPQGTQEIKSDIEGNLAPFQAYRDFVVPENVRLTFISYADRREIKLNPGVKLRLSNAYQDARMQRYPTFRERLAYIGDIPGAVLVQRNNDNFGAVTRVPPIEQSENYDRIPKGKDMADILEGKIPSLEWKNDQFRRLKQDFPDLGLKQHELVYVLEWPDPTRMHDTSQTLVTVMTSNGREYQIPRSYLDENPSKDKTKIIVFKDKRWMHFKEQLKNAGINIDYLPSIYPDVIIARKSMVLPLSHAQVRMESGDQSTSLGNTDPFGVLRISLRDKLSCRDLAPYEEDAVTLKTGNAETEISLDRLAIPIMSDEEIRAYIQHIIASKVGEKLGPSLSYVDRFPEGCMAGRVKEYISRQLQELYQGLAVLDQNIQVPAGMCEGADSLPAGEKLYFARSPGEIRVATLDGRCEGEMDSGIPLSVLECHGTKEEQKLLGDLRELIEIRTSEKSEDIKRILILKKLQDMGADILPGRENVLEVLYSFLRKYPESCHRDAAMAMIIQYAEAMDYRLVTLRNDTPVHFSWGGYRLTEKITRGGKVFVKRINQNRGMNIRDILSNLVPQEQMWFVTTPDGFMAGATTSTDLFGVYEEEPQPLRETFKMAVKGATTGIVVGFQALEAVFGPFEGGGPSPEFEEYSRRKKTEKKLKASEREQEKLRKKQRKEQRRENCRESCGKHFDFCQRCSKSEPLLCGGFMGKPNISQCVENRESCLNNCQYR